MEANKTAILSAWSFSHLLIDFACAASIFSLWGNDTVSVEDFVHLVIFYNVLAFGTQLLFGYLADKYKCASSIGLLGVLLVFLGIIEMFFLPQLAIILLGIGNACFHIGGGVITLALSGGRATENGIFVAPGAIGLFLGIWAGKEELFPIWVISIILWIVGIFLIVVTKNFNPYKEISYVIENSSTQKLKLPIIIIIALLFISIIIRSFVGFIINYPWKIGIVMGLGFTVVLALGKALGGVIADKFGWMKIGVGSLLLSLPCLLLGGNLPFFGFLGIFLFNITMAIALVALYATMRERPGLCFGILCMALLFGALPYLINMDFQGTEKILLIYLILLSAGCLGVSLYAEEK